MPAPRIPLPVAVILGVLAFVVVVSTAWWHWAKLPVDRLHYPLETALRMVERGMEFREATRGAGPVEKSLLWLVGDSPERDSKYYLEMYRELLRAPADSSFDQENKPWVQAHLIVLLGELGKTNECRAELERSRKHSDDPLFAAAVQRVYLRETPSSAYSNLPSAAESLSAGWTRNRFAARLAVAEGRIADARALESEILSNGQRWRHRVMTSLAVDLALIVAALAILIRVRRRDGFGWQRGPDDSFAPWPFRDGLGILFASFTAGPVLLILMVFPLRDLLYHWFSLLYAVPAVALVALWLLRPHALGFRRHFGIEFSRNALTVALGGGIVILGLDLLSWQVAGRVGYLFGLDSHWTEGLDEDLLYSDWAVKLAVLVNMAVFAPFGEELLFRGVLFGTLRKRMGPLAAALISSAAFALIHHYSVIGLLGVFCMGFACAMVYERTRNLGACIAGHMLTNLLVGLYEIALLG